MNKLVPIVSATLPVLVAATGMRFLEFSAPSVKQRLAAIRLICSIG